MSDLPSNARYTLHRSTGTVEPGLTAQEISNRILDGRISEIDFISAPGGGPRPYWQLKEFAPIAARVKSLAPSLPKVTHTSGSGAANSAPTLAGLSPSLAQTSAIHPKLFSSNSEQVASSRSTNARLYARPTNLFADNLLRLRLPLLAERLQDMALHEVTGASLDDSPEAIAKAAQARIKQLQAQFEPRLCSDEDKESLAAIIDIIRRAAATFMLDEPRALIVKQAETTGRLPLLREIAALLTTSESANEVLDAVAPQQSSARPPQITNSTNLLIQALGTGSAVRNILPPRNFKPQQTTKPAVFAAPVTASDHPPLDEQWGIGSPDIGARAAMGPLVAVWVTAIAMVLLTDWGRFEHQLGLLDPMNLVRLLLLVGMTLFATIKLRRQPLSKLFARPIHGWCWALPLAGLLCGFMLAEFWSFSYDRTAGIGAILLIATLRAVSEGLFFEGHVARTMFVEARSPAVGVLLSAGGSAAYMASFFDILRSDTPLTPFILALWFLFVGVPAALTLWVSRSVWIAVCFRFCVLVALYLMQSNAAD